MRRHVASYHVRMVANKTKQEREAKRQRGLLEAWADGYALGLLYRAALWPFETEQTSSAPTLGELRAAGAERYADTLSIVGRWRDGEVWGIVLWPDEDGGARVFFCLEPTPVLSC